MDLALMSRCMQTKHGKHLTTHAILPGRPMPVPYLKGAHKGPTLDLLTMELQSYAQQLTSTHEVLFTMSKKPQRTRLQKNLGHFHYTRRLGVKVY